MPKFKNKVIRKADGGKYYPGGGEGPGNYNMAESVRDSLARGVNQSVNKKMSDINKFNDRVGGPLYGLKNGRSPAYSPGMMREGIGGDIIPLAPSPSSGLSGMNLAQKALDKFSKAESKQKSANAPKMGSIYTKPVSVSGEGSEVEMERSPNPYVKLDPFSPDSDLETPPELASVSSSGADMSKMFGSTPSGNIPKTKSGMKKFMDQYGKFIALGALAGTQGKKGMIAAPIIAALPGILKMLQNRGKKTTDAPAAPAKFPGYSEYDYMTAPEKKMAGGAIRKFKGGSMNTMKENLVPKYKYGGDMPKGMPKEMMAMMGKKGKATGDMPEHKKMDMGMPIGKMPDSKKMGMAKPKPSSMDQKFAKGGTARYASGGMCKGYGIAKKIRPTGSMN